MCGMERDSGCEGNRMDGLLTRSLMLMIRPDGRASLSSQQSAMCEEVLCRPDDNIQ